MSKSTAELAGHRCPHVQHAQLARCTTHPPATSVAASTRSTRPHTMRRTPRVSPHALHAAGRGKGANARSLHALNANMRAMRQPVDGFVR